MMIDALFVDRQAILAVTFLMWSVTGVMNWATLHKTAPTRFPPRNTRTPRQVSFQAMIHQHPKGQITIHWHRHGRHFNWSQSHCQSHLNRSSNSYKRHTLQSQSSLHSGSCYPSADRHCDHHLCQDTPHRNSCIPSGRCISPTYITHATTPQTIAGLALATCMNTTASEEGQATSKPFHSHKTHQS